ncbi:integrase, catalytic region, zinc finger, CCHC-type containing protein [Tanacetum coccineum]
MLGITLEYLRMDVYRSVWVVEKLIWVWLGLVMPQGNMVWFKGWSLGLRYGLGLGHKFKENKAWCCIYEGIKRDYSNAKTPQQNRVAERKNKILIEAARTMLADSKFPTMFWTEAVVLLVCSLQSVTLILLGAQWTILNTSDHLGNLKEKVMKVFIVWYTRSYILLVLKIDSDSECLKPLFRSYGTKETFESAIWFLLVVLILLLDFYWFAEPFPTIIEPVHAVETSLPPGHSLGSSEHSTRFPSPFDLANSISSSSEMEDIYHYTSMAFSSSSYDADFGWILGDLTSPVVRQRGTLKKSKLVERSFRKRRGIDYDEVFAPVARIEAIRLFLAFTSYMGFMVYQIDVKSAFLYGEINEEVYVTQPKGFEDPHFPKHVYKVVKASYGLHQAPRAWYARLSTFLLKHNYRRGTIDKTLFIKKNSRDIILVQVYVDDIIFGSTKKAWCDEFEVLMKGEFEMSVMGELTFFLGLQVKQKPDGIFISQDKYVQDILKKFDMESLQGLILCLLVACSRHQVTLCLPNLNASHEIIDYAGSHGDRKSTTGGCQFLGRRLISWQCKKQTIVATSSTEAEYVAAANCCGQHCLSTKSGSWDQFEGPSAIALISLLMGEVYIGANEFDPDLFTSTNVEDETLGGSFHTTPPRLKKSSKPSTRPSGFVGLPTWHGKFKWTEKTVPVAEGSSETTIEGYIENYKNVSQDIRDQLNAEAEAVQIILTGIDNDIYSTIGAYLNACEMWKAIERLKQGESINVQDLETNLYWEFGKFTSRDGESQESYYSRFYKMMNELVRNQCDVTNHQVNVQFLLQLQPEWQRFVTLVKQKPEMVVEDDALSKEKEIVKRMALISIPFKKIYKPINTTSELHQTPVEQIRIILQESTNKRKLESSCYNDNLALMLAPDFEETIRLAQESRSKLSDLIRPFDYKKLNNLYDLFVPQREKSLEQRYFSERSKMSHTLAKNENSKESFNKYTTLLERRMDESIPWDEKCKSSKELFKIKSSVDTIFDGVERCKQAIAKRTYFEQVVKCEHLEKELSKSNSMSKSFEALQQHAINLELALQQCQEQIKNDKAFKEKQSTLFQKERKPTTFSDSFAKKDFSKSKSVTKNDMSNDFSNPVTAQILPQNVKSILKNTNVIAPEMYNVHTKHNQNRTSQLPQDIRKTNKRVSFSTGVIPTTSVSIPQLKSNQLEDKVMPNNSQGKKQEVEDHRRNFKFSNNKMFITACNDSLNAKTSNVNFVCVTCGKCVLNDNHDICVLHYINGVNSRTRQLIAVPISTREPKRTMNQSVATPLKRTVASESTNQKPRHTTRKLYEHVSKTCSWWYPMFTPSGYKWKPSSPIGNVNTNVNMPQGNASRNANILEPMTPRCSTLSSTPLSSNSFSARRDNSIHRRLWVLKAHDGKYQASKVYYVEGLNHNLFSVGQFCNADLEVAFWKSTCYVRDLKGNDLLTGSRGTDLYSITLQNTTSLNPICLMAKAKSSQAWLWHRRLSYLNFDSINLLSKNNIMIGLPKLKFIKDHLCSSCELGKAK